MRPLIRILLAASALSIAAALAPAIGWAHGGDSMEAENLSEQPARTLAQQAMSELRVRHDMDAAAEQLDAAVESKDQSDVDSALVNQAMEALDAGREDEAISTLDRALSRPLGEESGAALHESGREFQPGTDTQEVVAIVLGAALLLLAGFLLFRGRRVGAPSP
jgi:LPXTG-motif cell wall-anchored protein